MFPPQETLSRLIPPSRQMRTRLFIVRLLCILPIKARPAIPKGRTALAYRTLPFRSGRFELVTEAAVMVRVEAAVPVPGTKFAGAKLQLNPLGRPAHESAIELLKEPDCGLAVIC